jgi:hypothetical protein
LDEVAAKTLAQSFTTHLNASREAGYSDCSPGRFLLPGDLAGSHVLTFAPLREVPSKRGSLGREFERRFESYKRNVVRPFFRDHFPRLTDRLFWSTYWVRSTQDHARWMIYAGRWPRSLGRFGPDATHS